MIDVFVITPYRHENSKIVEQRVKTVNLYVGSLTQAGLVVYSTVSAMHHLAEMCSLPSDWKYWEKHCATMIECSKVVHLLQLDGWEESEGVQGEIEIANNLNKKILNVDSFPVDI
jgi:hypothetical protein